MLQSRVGISNDALLSSIIGALNQLVEPSSQHSFTNGAHNRDIEHKDNVRMTPKAKSNLFFTPKPAVHIMSMDSVILCLKT